MKALLFRSGPNAIVAAAIREVRSRLPSAKITLLENKNDAAEFDADDRRYFDAKLFESETVSRAVAGEKFDLVVVPESDAFGEGYGKVEEAARALRTRVLFVRPGIGLVEASNTLGRFTATLAGTATAMIANLLRIFLRRKNLDPIFTPTERHSISDIYFLERASIENGLAQALTPRSGTLIDIGCGAMPHRALAESKGYRYLGIDIEKRTNRDRLVFGSAWRIPLRAESAEVAWSVETIEHLQEPAEFAREAARILKPGGLFILVAPQVWGLHEEPNDYWRFTCYGLEHLARAAGLEIVRSVPRGGYRIAAFQRFISHLNRMGLERVRLSAPFDWVSSLNRLAVACDADPNEALGWILIARKPESR